MNRRVKGFTLVEMLAALMAASLLIGLVYGAVRIGQRSVSAIDERSDDAEIMRIGWQFLHDAVSRARAVPDPEQDDDPISFDGSPQGMRFVADMPSYVGLGGLMRISLAIHDDGAEQRLVLSRERFDISGEAPDRPNEEQAVLVRDLDNLEIHYLGEDPEDGSQAWRHDWHDLDVLPSLVRVLVTPNNAPPWPVMIASPANGNAPIGDLESLEDDAEMDAEMEAQDQEDH